MNPIEPFEQHFGGLEEPRKLRGSDHPLVNILFITVCAVIAGADDWVEVETFGHERRSFFERYLDLSRGIPSHDTFGRVFRLLNPEAFASCFSAWMKALVTLSDGEVVAIDGKTIRRSFDKVLGKGAVHIVSAFAAANGVVLGQLQVADKENEILAVPVLLEMLDLAGCVVTLDAIGCQKKIAAKIVEQGADYILRLKDNHPLVAAEVREAFEEATTPHSDTVLFTHETTNDGHGRVEVRRVSCTSTLDWFADKAKWSGLRSFVKVTSERHVGENTTVEDRYYLSSLPSNSEADAARLNSSIRRHWSIENESHWVLDVVFREDNNRVRKDDGAQNIAIVRKLALNLLRLDKTLKGSIKVKRRRVSWNPEEYLPRVLLAGAHS